MDRLRQRFPRYSKLLALYPASYRKEYEEQQLQTLADMLDDAERSRAGIWTRTILDFPFSVIKQQLSYTGGVMNHDMPDFVKRNALVSGVLLLPFFAALIANGLNKLIHNRDLYDSWLWHRPVLAIWVVWLPLAAAVIALISLLGLLIQRGKREHTSWFRQLFNVRYNWPLLLTAGAGLFILALVFGHDSVHCIIGNPVRELRDAHQTWQCIQQR